MSLIRFQTSGLSCHVLSFQEMVVGFRTCWSIYDKIKKKRVEKDTPEK